MTVAEVITNLDRTVAGKTDLLAGVVERFGYDAPAAMLLRINIAELGRIKADLEKIKSS